MTTDPGIPEEASARQQRLRAHKVYAALRPWLPRAMAEVLRRLVIAVYTPVFFSLVHRHYKSAWRQLALDRHGDLVPWFTYPAIDLLRTVDFADKRVLEFGGGGSTVYWNRQGAGTVTFETNWRWAHFIWERLPHPELADIRVIRGDDFEAVEAALADSSFDLIVIDGLDRLQLLLRTAARLARHGAIIFDNAEGYGFRTALESSALEGFAKVDLYGHAPGVVRRHCTSVLFRQGEQCFLFERANAPLTSASLNT